jgi:hypothetical protein
MVKKYENSVAKWMRHRGEVVKQFRDLSHPLEGERMSFIDEVPALDFLIVGREGEGISEARTRDERVQREADTMYSGCRLAEDSGEGIHMLLPFHEDYDVLPGHPVGRAESLNRTW